MELLRLTNVAVSYCTIFLRANAVNQGFLQSLFDSFLRSIARLSYRYGLLFVTLVSAQFALFDVSKAHKTVVNVCIHISFSY